MFRAVAKLFGYLLYGIYGVVNNYGVSIILFTLITKLILLPFTIKQQKSLELNKEMQPKLQELQNRYGDDKQKLSEEYQKLMKETKYNPFGGCLLSLIQIPIILGMLYVVGEPLTSVLKWPQDDVKQAIIEIMPESYEGDYDRYIRENRYPQLKVVKEKKLLNLDFLGINLGDVASENSKNLVLVILPVLSAIFTYISFSMVNGNQEKQVMKDADGNEIPMPNMGMYNILLPAMSGYIAYIVPQGLALYWFFNSVLQISINFGMKKFMNKSKNN